MVKMITDKNVDVFFAKIDTTYLKNYVGSIVLNWLLLGFIIKLWAMIHHFKIKLINIFANLYCCWFVWAPKWPADVKVSVAVKLLGRENYVPPSTSAYFLVWIAFLLLYKWQLMREWSEEEWPVCAVIIICQF